MQQTKYTAKTVANWFVETGMNANKTIDMIKLLKLVYIAQGIALGMGKPLFDEKIQAWDYGPIIESVYLEFKGNEGNPIQKPYVDIIYSGKKFEVNIPRIKDDDKEAIDILEATWKNFSDLTEIQLSNWSHGLDSPWFKTWRKINHKSNAIPLIKDELIAAYFKKNFLTRKGE